MKNPIFIRDGRLKCFFWIIQPGKVITSVDVPAWLEPTGIVFTTFREGMAIDYPGTYIRIEGNPVTSVPVRPTFLYADEKKRKFRVTLDLDLEQEFENTKHRFYQSPYRTKLAGDIRRNHIVRNPKDVEMVFSGSSGSAVTGSTISWRPAVACFTEYRFSRFPRIRGVVVGKAAKE